VKSGEIRSMRTAAVLGEPVDQRRTRSVARLPRAFLLDISRAARAEMVSSGAGSVGRRACAPLVDQSVMRDRQEPTTGIQPLSP